GSCTRGIFGMAREDPRRTCGWHENASPAPTVAFHFADNFLSVEAMTGTDDPVCVFNGRPFGVPVRQSSFAGSVARRARSCGRGLFRGPWRPESAFDARARSDGHIGGGAGRRA